MSRTGATPVKKKTSGDRMSGMVQSGARYPYIVARYMTRCQPERPRTRNGFERSAMSSVPLAYLNRCTVQAETSWGESIRVRTRGW